MEYSVVHRSQALRNQYNLDIQYVWPYPVPNIIWGVTSRSPCLEGFEDRMHLPFCVTYKITTAKNGENIYAGHIFFCFHGNSGLTDCSTQTEPIIIVSRYEPDIPWLARLMGQILHSVDDFGNLVTEMKKTRGKFGLKNQGGRQKKLLCKISFSRQSKGLCGLVRAISLECWYGKYFELGCWDLSRSRELDNRGLLILCPPFVLFYHLVKLDFGSLASPVDRS